jgi:hypothetical protein
MIILCSRCNLRSTAALNWGGTSYGTLKLARPNARPASRRQTKGIRGAGAGWLFCVHAGLSSLYLVSSCLPATRARSFWMLRPASCLLLSLLLSMLSSHLAIDFTHDHDFTMDFTTYTRGLVFILVVQLIMINLETNAHAHKLI